MGKTKTRVTLDTNILISALGWQGNPHRILQKVINGETELFISHEQFEELTRVLDYPKFDFTEAQKARFKALISAMATFVNPSARLDTIKEDPSDNKILDSALAAKVDFIVSGDGTLTRPRKTRWNEDSKSKRVLESESELMRFKRGEGFLIESAWRSYVLTRNNH